MKLAARAQKNHFGALLARFVREHPRLFVLTGAGTSTASGIPDYRDHDCRWKREPPAYLADFLASKAARRRYWARSMFGWPLIADARPNAAHAALTRLQELSCLHRLITQNVDGLHQRAGTAGVIELHGNLAQVLCVHCECRMARGEIQRRLESDNPFQALQSRAIAPDGDADATVWDVDGFVVPDCPRCGGILKPGVVFFGETVPRDRVEEAVSALQSADGMLVVGSSLALRSGYRFCEIAHQWQKPIAAINIGRTRADHLFQLKIEQPCAETLTELVSML